MIEKKFDLIMFNIYKINTKYINMVILAVVGSREFNNYKLLKDKLNSIENISKIVSGGAFGADKLAELYAEEYNIETNIIKPNWSTYGKSAGAIRNKEIIL